MSVRVKTTHLRINRRQLEKLGINMRGVTYKVDKEGIVVRVMASGFANKEQLDHMVAELAKVQKLWETDRIRDPWKSYGEKQS